MSTIVGKLVMPARATSFTAVIYANVAGEIKNHALSRRQNQKMGFCLKCSTYANQPKQTRHTPVCTCFRSMN